MSTENMSSLNPPGDTKDKESENSSLDDQYSSDEEETELGNLCVNKKTPLYVINVNDEPKYYTKSQRNAKNAMWRLVRRARSNWENYSTYICQDDDEFKVQLVGFQRLIIVSYERILVTVSITKLYELCVEDKCCKGGDTSQSEDSQEESSDDYDNTYHKD